MERIRNQKDVDNRLVQLLERSPLLEPIAKAAGRLPLRLQEPGFPGLARIIIGQQVSTASAAAIHKRFLEHINPVTPENFITAGELTWVTIGLSRAKQTTLSGLASALIDNSLNLEQLIEETPEAAIDRLTELKGIGPWTAEVYLLFCAGHSDIFPAGDLALQEAVRFAFELETRPTTQQTREIAAQWAPFRGIAARLFWAYYRSVRQGREGIPV